MGMYPNVHLKANGGIDTERSYPYEGVEEACHFDPDNVGETDKGFVDIPAGSEDDLKTAVATVGPVSVAIDAGHVTFQVHLIPASLFQGVVLIYQSKTDLLLALFPRCLRRAQL